jgi:hypothetical protein
LVKNTTSHPSGASTTVDPDREFNVPNNNPKRVEIETAVKQMAHDLPANNLLLLKTKLDSLSYEGKINRFWSNFKSKKYEAGHQWLTPVILATQEGVAQGAGPELKPQNHKK